MGNSCRVGKKTSSGTRTSEARGNQCEIGGSSITETGKKALFVHGFRVNFDLPLNRSHAFARNINELNPDSDTRKAIPNLGARMDFVPRKSQTEPYVKHGAFGEDSGGVDEHAPRTDVGRAGDNVLAVAFICHGKVAQA